MKEEESPFAILIECLTQDELTDEARELDVLLREVAWTTGSEFLGEFGQKMKEIKTTQWDHMQDGTQAAFTNAAGAVLKVWPEIGL